MHGKEGAKVYECEFCNNFEGFVAVDWLNDASDVMHVPAEGFTGPRADAGADQLMYLVNIINRLSVDPNHRNNIEERPPFGEGLRRHKNTSPHRIHQLLYNPIVNLKSPSVVLLQMYINRLEELQRIIHDLATVMGEVRDADVDDVHYEGLETCLRELFDVQPEASC